MRSYPSSSFKCFWITWFMKIFYIFAPLALQINWSSIIISSWSIAKITKLFLFINVDYQITDVQLLCTFCPFFCWRKNRDWRTSNSKKSASVRITSEEIQEGNQDRSGMVQGQPWVCLEYIGQHMNSWWRWKSSWRRHSLVVWHIPGMVLWVHSALQKDQHLRSHMP